MSDPKLVSPLLDGFVMGEPMSSHDGVRCCPAIRENSEEKYIVKIISVPASQRQLDALLLTGAYKDPAAAADYFKELADGVVAEAQLLQQLSKLEGFLPYSGWQVVPMGGDDLGYEIYLVSPYKRSLEKFLRRNPMTHLGAVNLGLDLCAALAICRRAGNMFVDLKPSNIFLTGDREYRISDLGFVKLNSLKYTSLPSKYRSVYTPPELHDDLCTLNPTADIYAVGMILYRIYNNGQLPFEEIAPTKALPAPLNADYEMAEIILKACDPNPRKRYQTPIEMGQALVSYMQRNTVNDVPIVPPAAQLAEEEPEAPAEQEEAAAAPEDETLPDADRDEVPAEVPLTEEVTTMFDQADGLLAGPVPSMEDAAEEPEPPQPEHEPVPQKAEEEDEDWDKLIYGGNEEQEDPGYFDDDDDEDFFAEPKPAKKPKKGMGVLIVLLLLLVLLLGGGYYYYQNFYLLPIDNMSISGYEDSITVVLTTDVDTSILEVVCTDSYGNTQRAPIENGQAFFSGLSPDTQYKVTVVSTEGFHKVSKSYYGSYSTGKQTNIVDFTAKTGLEDGSVILNFTVDGPESQDWVVEYVTEGEPTQSISFTGHMVTISGLTVGRMYEFTLLPPPGADQWVAGTTQLEFAAARMVVAENVSIVSCEDGVLTAQWNAPADITVNSWTVRCYSENGYDQTLTVTEPTAQFEGITADAGFTLEVWAEGMTQSARAYVSANPTVITGTAADLNESDASVLDVSWTFEGTAPEEGWLVLYTVDGREAAEVVTCESPACAIKPIVPGAEYSLAIQNADGSTVFNGLFRFASPEAPRFNDHSLSADSITASLCPTPEKEGWSYKDVKEEDYVSAFASGAKASLVLYSSEGMNYPKNDTRVMFVIRNESGQVISELTRTETRPWNTIWKNRYASLDIPVMPTDPGSYSMEIYFDGAFAVSKSFSVTE